LIFVPVKKKFELHPMKKKLFEKGPWPHFMADLAWFWPRGTDVTVHVIKKIKIKKNYGNYFLNLKIIKNF